MTDSILDEIRAFSPAIRELGQRIDADGEVPSEVIDRLLELGVFRLVAPAEFGGCETEPQQLVEIFEELGRADAAAGWVAMISAVTGVALGRLPAELATSMLDDKRFVINGVGAPMGRTTPVDGGYRLTGRWSFASGCRYATWFTLGGFTPEGPRIFVLEADSVTIHDTWHAMGLTGTGSHDLSVEDVFVPADRVFDLAAPPRVDSALYRFSPYSILAIGIGAVALGIARAAIEDFTELARTKRNPATRTTIAAKPAVRTAVAEATALHRSGLAYLLHEFAMPRLDESGRAAQRLAIATATRNAARAVDLLYNAAGGSAVYLTSPLQRHFRNVHAATQHAMVSSDVVETTGAVLLGEDVNTTVL